MNAAISIPDLRQRLRKHRVALLVAGGIGLIVLSLYSCASGDVRIAPARVAGLLFELTGLREEAAATTLERAVVRDIRLPRLVLGLAVGATLGVAGAVMQGLFRNPLADPGLIGVSAGGAAGAVLFIVVGGLLLEVNPFVARLGLPAFAIAGGVVTTLMIYHLSLVEGRSHIATLLLTGLAVNALVNALVGFMIFKASDAQIRDFTFWTLGSLANASWSLIAISVPVMLGLTATLLFFAVHLNALLLGEAEAHHLGLNVQRTKHGLILLSAGAVAISVALCGIIGFVGLVVPHAVRLAIGPDHRFLLPGAALLGAGLLTIADLVARNAIRFSELPVGVVTASIGAPFFLLLLLQTKRQTTGA